MYQTDNVTNIQCDSHRVLELRSATVRKFERNTVWRTNGVFDTNFDS